MMSCIDRQTFRHFLFFSFFLNYRDVVYMSNIDFFYR